LVLWLGVSIATLRAFGWIPSNGFTSYAVQLSTVVEMALMALALADLLRIEHEAHGATQAQALEANRALLEMTQASEDKLKRAVESRTEQLEASLEMETGLRDQYVRFGSMISHEFRTPLSVIQSQTSLMRKEHERGIDQVTKRLGAISSATQRLIVMFDKWLHSGAINQTLEVLEPKPLDLQPWLGTVIRTSSHLSLNHCVTLQLHPEVNMVLADEYHLGVALTNLIDNAAKYSPVDTTITIATVLKEDHVGIAVTDLGPGIPLEAQDKVFAEFFRLSPESNVRGVGLGLSIVQRIAKAHGGHVALRSAPGHGTTFSIWLPTFAPKEQK
jgi:signal transduction histidine kinase